MSTTKFTPMVEEEMSDEDELYRQEEGNDTFTFKEGGEEAETSSDSDDTDDGEQADGFETNDSLVLETEKAEVIKSGNVMLKSNEQVH